MTPPLSSVCPFKTPPCMPATRAHGRRVIFSCPFWALWYTMCNLWSACFWGTSHTSALCVFVARTPGEQSANPCCVVLVVRWCGCVVVAWSCSDELSIKLIVQHTFSAAPSSACWKNADRRTLTCDSCCRRARDLHHLSHSGGFALRLFMFSQRSAFHHEVVRLMGHIGHLHFLSQLSRVNQRYVQLLTPRRTVSRIKRLTNLERCLDVVSFLLATSSVAVRRWLRRSRLILRGLVRRQLLTVCVRDSCCRAETASAQL